MAKKWEQASVRLLLCDGDGGGRCDGRQLTVNVLGLVDVDLANLQLTVGGLGGTITAGKIVDDDAEDLLARNILDGLLEPLNGGSGVTG